MLAEPSQKKGSCAAVFVTHNSKAFIPSAMKSLAKQTLPPQQIVIVDSGSTDNSYLLPYGKQEGVDLVLRDNVGFCKGNNLGFEKVSAALPYVLFINPDLFLPPLFLEKGIALMEENPSWAALSGALLGYDKGKEKPTGRYDSTGVFCTWYGRWYDRCQGEEISSRFFASREEVPALCGALMLCRREALKSVLIRGEEVFDNSFYMYKEDIELSSRLRQAGWKLLFCPELDAYHCRGWKKNRAEMPKASRLASASNEIKVHWRSFSPLGLLYSSIKYGAVKALDL